MVATMGSMAVCSVTAGLASSPAAGCSILLGSVAAVLAGFRSISPGAAVLIVSLRVINILGASGSAPSAIELERSGQPKNQSLVPPTAVSGLWRDRKVPSAIDRDRKVAPPAIDRVTTESAAPRIMGQPWPACLAFRGRRRFFANVHCRALVCFSQ